jgi:ribosomal protein L29
MKRQELDQLRQKSKTELLKDAAALRKELVSGRMSRDQQVMANVRSQGNTRRRLAVLETLIRQKEK